MCNATTRVANNRAYWDIKLLGERRVSNSQPIGWSQGIKFFTKPGWVDAILPTPLPRFQVFVLCLRSVFRYSLFRVRGGVAWHGERDGVV